MYEDLLARVPLFANLSWRERAWIADACRERDYLPGDDLMRQDNTLGAGLYILISGRVRVSWIEAGALIAELEYAEAGAILGEQTLLDEVSTTTITAVEPTHALVLPIWDFRMTLRDFPDIAIHLLAILGQQLRQREGTT
ncbi:MAG: hypothetical protein OJF49_001927 [Ktedonobacterales bacterium]|jgi:CRP-like cAMP-binding protein|nr:MAG: hypothetical protein OJF49_001927 [Ktedonobacterales bacterium]